MTVFKTFWKIVNKYKGTIILYTVMLISFGGINLASNDTTTTFTSTLPNIAIIMTAISNHLSYFLDICIPHIIIFSKKVFYYFLSIRKLL